MPNFDNIRRWPLPVAEIANRIFRWSSEYCAGGCGYPVGRTHLVDLDIVDGVPVRAAICSLGGQCEYNVRNDPRDESGAPYAAVRPDIIAAVREAREGDMPPDDFVLSFRR